MKTVSRSMVCVGLFFSLAASSAGQEKVPLKKEIEGTCFKIVSEEKGVAVLGTSEDLFKGIDEKVLAKCRRWVNFGDPYLIIQVKDGKIAQAYLGADPWAQGSTDHKFKTVMHCVAEKFLGQAPTQENLKKLQARMKLAIELEFAD